MRINLTIVLLVMVMVTGLGATPALAQDTSPSVIIYPILVQAPIFGAKVEVPSIPGGGGGSEGESSSTDWGFNSAYMGGMEFHAKRVFGEFDVLWTKPSASHDATPRLDVTSDIWAVSLKGGYRVYKGFGITGGARYLALNLDATIEFPQSGITLEGSSKRSRWLPFVGADWRGQASRKWTLDFSADVGVSGSDDTSSRYRARADWQPLPHFSIRLGYQLLHLALGSEATLGGVSRQWSTKQNMYGPEFGIGFAF
ncbi:MAG TPA: hypothetical protein VGI12_13680 [Vicinamibacterales bacterium]|jgi:hypothetical protein